MYRLILILFIGLLLTPSNIKGKSYNPDLLYKEKLIRSVWLSKNSETANRQRLSIGLIQGKCDVANTLVTFYSSKPLSDVRRIEEKSIMAKFGDQRIITQILYAVEDTVGTVIWIDLGWKKIDDFKRFFYSKPLLTLRLESGEDFVIDDYFSLRQNTWKMDGIDEALDKAFNICEKFRI